MGVTDAIIAAVIGGVILVDIALARNQVPNYKDTISARMKWIGWHVPALPFGFCMLASHFWINTDWEVLPSPWNYWALAGAGAAWIVFGLFWRTPQTGRGADKRVRWVMMIAMATGLVAGALLWPQRPISLH